MSWISGDTFAVSDKTKLVPNREELIAIIEEYGGKVTNCLSDEVDFYICTCPDSDPKATLAKNLGIRIMSEYTLIDFVTYC